MRAAGIIFFLFAVLVACSNKSAQLDRIEIKLDSIYVDEEEGSDTVKGELLIVYYCTLRSLGDSIINMQVRNYYSEEKPEANFNLINSRDTLGLYLVTPKSLKVSPKGELHFGLATSTIGVVDLFEKYGYSHEHHSKSNKLTEFEFLRKIARESFILFEWRGHKREIRDLENVKISYRDPNDNTIK
ncbi:MAG TPA: hypothetical protein VIU12_17340 [Chryseolinea sp.]